jgi:hypothetical protein
LTSTKTRADNTFSNFTLSGGALNAYASNPYYAPTAAIGLTLGDPNFYGQTGPWPTFATNGAIPDTQFCSVVSFR